LPHWFNDDMAWILDCAYNPFRSSSWTVKGEFVDRDKFDVVPRPEYKKELIESKQKEIDNLEEQKKRLEQEIKELKA